jgi:hypothetical protein
MRRPSASVLLQQCSAFWLATGNFYSSREADRVRFRNC